MNSTSCNCSDSNSLALALVAGVLLLVCTVLKTVVIKPKVVLAGPLSSTGTVAVLY